MESDASRSLQFDASQFYDSPDLSDVTIVLVEDSDEAEERAAKRQRTGDGADGAQDAVDAAAAGAAADRPTVRLHGHKFLLCACSSVMKTRIANWSHGDGNDLVLHVSVTTCMICQHRGWLAAMRVVASILLRIHCPGVICTRHACLSSS